MKHFASLVLILILSAKFNLGKDTLDFNTTNDHLNFSLVMKQVDVFTLELLLIPIDNHGCNWIVYFDLPSFASYSEPHTFVSVEQRCFTQLMGKAVSTSTLFFNATAYYGCQMDNNFGRSKRSETRLTILNPKEQNELLEKFIIVKIEDIC